MKIQLSNFNTIQIKQILESIGYKLLDKGSEWRTKPLYRESNNSNSLRIIKRDGRWVDFGLSKGGLIEELIRITLNLSNLNDVKDWLDSNKIYSENNTKSNFEYPNIDIQETFNFQDLEQTVKDYSYWKSRGISEEIVMQFEGGIIDYNVKSSFCNRFIFPIFNSQKKIIGFAGRWLGQFNNKIPKWKIIGQKEKFSFPLILNINDILANRYVILLESIGDTLSCFEIGYRSVICLFGVSISANIICLLIKLNPKKIFICLNNDEDNNFIGNKSAFKIKKILINYFDENQINILTPKENDLNDMLLKNRDNFINFLSQVKVS